MTEAEWLTATKPERLLDGLPETVSGRKLRLFAVACCRRIWQLMTDERCRVAVELGERAADCEIDDTTLDQASGAAQEAYEEVMSEWIGGETTGATLLPGDKAFPCEAASYASNTPAVRIDDAIRVADDTSGAVENKHDEEVTQSALLRCIFGNPFRPVAFDPRWRSEAAVALAAGIYEERAFDRLPILADALEEAGCDHPDVLSHCRGPGPHARGCWVVDQVLGKA